jgi:glycosyltransferase involved in cell wall biosynthesis
MLVLQYARPASGQNETEVFGLDVAVNNFLSAWFRHGRQDKFICRPSDFPSLDHFKELAAAAGHDPENKCIGIDPRTPKQNLENVSCIFRADPLTVDLTWTRQQLQGNGFATCGLVHTMSGERIARAVGELCLAPTDGTDALICPSNAIRDAVKNLWEIYADYLNHRFGGTFVCPIETPVIPLGVDTEKFIRRTTADKREAQREALKTKPDEIVVLFVGRLSFATKAHPLALFRAAEKAAQAANRPVRLVMFGYYKPKDMQPYFENLATDIGKTVRIEFVMNDDVRFPDGLWAGADIFVSLADNIQESFGLTPIEAMAAGLPAVISDWDGYRGSVRDGVDGYLIPTLTPPPEAGKAISDYYFNHRNYGVSLVGAAQSTTVDTDRCAEALTILINDDDKRRAFGASGRQRAQDVFDWRHIIRAYENLWQTLGDKRRNMPRPRAVPDHWPAAHPAFPNPWKMFGSFPSRILSPDDRLQIVMPPADIAVTLKHDMNFFLPDLLVPRDDMMALIEAVRAAGAPFMHDILAPFPATEHDRIWRCIGWMLKHGVGVRV